MSPGLISRVVVADKASAIRRMIGGIRSLPLDTVDTFTADPRMVAAGDSYLRRALEALLDLARHLLAKGFGRAPAEYAAVARELGEVGVVDTKRAARLAILARYRNRMVHFYDEISETELHGILSRDIGDVEDLLTAMLEWVAAHPDRVNDGAGD